MDARAAKVIRKLQKLARDKWAEIGITSPDTYERIIAVSAIDAYRNAARIVREEFKEVKP